MNHFIKKIDQSQAEYEAQFWALNKAEKLEYKLILFFVVSVFMGWADMKKKKQFSCYYNAYKKFSKIMGKYRINKFKTFLEQCEFISKS